MFSFMIVVKAFT